VIKRIQVQTLTFTLARTLLGHQPAFDPLLHPLGSPVGAQTCHAALSVVELSLLRSIKLLFLLLVDYSVIGKVGVALSDKRFPFDVITVMPVSTRNLTMRIVAY
jgi:hypothetical protein